MPYSFIIHCCISECENDGFYSFDMEPETESLVDTRMAAIAAGWVDEVTGGHRLTLCPKHVRDRPKCRCGDPCAYYGTVGGYSVACEICNENKAANARSSRRHAKPKPRTRLSDVYRMHESAGDSDG